MNFTDFEQFFYREPFVESITTGGNFQLISDEEIRGAETFIHVSSIGFFPFDFYAYIRL